MNIKYLLASGATLALVFALAASPAFAKNDSHSKTTEVRSGTSVAIGNNGGVLVRGAEVTAVSGSTVTARTTWGDTSVSWTVQTDGDTDFIDLGGDGSALADVNVGETISFSGYIDTDDGAFSVDADVLRNWSEGEKHDSRSVNAEVKAEISGKNHGFWNKIFGGFKFGHN